MNSLSETPVGQSKKYNRESMDGKTVKILKAQMFNPDVDNDKLITSMTNKDVKYYKTKFILTYDEENSEGVKHREYISGGIQFLQKDSTISVPSLWYESANNQISELFAKVADFKKITPKELSPREFMNFLNSGPKCVIKWTDVEFNKNITQKNLVEKFL
jgi:dimeric dUTPase (all-alpha-NTP-PPase superfamily)